MSIQASNIKSDIIHKWCVFGRNTKIPLSWWIFPSDVCILAKYPDDNGNEMKMETQKKKSVMKILRAWSIQSDDVKSSEVLKDWGKWGAEQLK